MVEASIEKVKKYLRGSKWKPAPREYLDYKLMTDLWKCPPSVFEDQPEEMIDLHIGIYVEEVRARELDALRESQKHAKS